MFRSLALNALIVVAVLLFAVLCWREFSNDDVLIEPVVVPAAFASAGLTSDVVTRQLQDALLEVERSLRGDPVTVSASAGRYDFSIPDSGLSFQTLVGAVREALGIPKRRVLGEITCPSGDCDLRTATMHVRLLPNANRDASRSVSGQALYRSAAIAVLELVDSYSAAIALMDYQPLRTLALANEVIIRGGAETAWAHNAIGSVRAQWQDYHGAALAFEEAVRADPKVLIARQNLAQLALILGEEPAAAAEKAYEEFRAIRDARPAAYELYARGLADALVRVGKGGEARSLLIEAAIAQPESPIYPYELGQLAARNGMTSEALSYYHTALRADPSHVLTVTTLVMYYRSLGLVDEAEAILRSTKGYAREGLVYLAYASALMENGEIELARGQIAHALQADPGNVLILVTGAQLAEDRWEGIGLLHEAASMAPPSPSISMTLAVAYYQAGCIERAKDYLRRAIDLAPSGPFNKQAKDGLAELERGVTGENTTPDPRCGS